MTQTALQTQRADYNQIALNSFFTIASNWKLSNAQARNLLGDPAEATFYNWKNGKIGKLSKDTLHRLSMILGIHKGLRILFKNPINLYDWVNRENSDFGGETPLQRMLHGQLTDIHRVRQYIDHWRGGK